MSAHEEEGRQIELLVELCMKRLKRELTEGELLRLAVLIDERGLAVMLAAVCEAAEEDLVGWLKRS